LARDQNGYTKLVLPAILLVVLAFTFYTPYLLINSDSVHGFEAMNGSYWTGKWNTMLQFNESTRLLYEKFLTWWSPGQYLAPLLFMKLLHIQLGTSVVLVNFLSTLLGTIGFFFVFKRYGFDRLTIWISIIFILISSSVLAGYYNYNGGECLNFMIFPWIIMTQKLLVQRVWKFIFPGLILFIAFICKLQMLIVVPPLLFLLIFIQKEDLNFGFIKNKRFRFRETVLSNYLPLFLSVVPVILFIYFSFIFNRSTPVQSVKHLSLNAVSVFFPVSSPVISIYVFDSLHYYLSAKPGAEGAYLFILSAILIVSLVWVVRHFRAYAELKRKYIFLALSLYGISAAVFIVLYTKGTPIDLNPRHLKLSSYLLYPVLAELALLKFKRVWVLGVLTLFGSFALANHVRLTRTWNRNTTITKSGFRLFQEDMPLSVKDSLDGLIKTKTVVVSPYESRYAIDNQLILPILSEKDIRPDLKKCGYPVIFIDSLK